MQLLARDGPQTLSASAALKGKDYLCPECGTSVRVRKGPHRQAHFYHMSTVRTCRQQQKSAEHLHLQLRLVQLLGAHAEMECPFPEINRIADVVCHARKCVFEVQCSPLTLEEAKQRCEDYRRAGYEIVWILHAMRFNQKKIGAAENFLRGQPCYFTNADRKGRGILYDQFEVIIDHRRTFRGPPLAVAIDKLLPVEPKECARAPLAIQKRYAAWKIHAQGDLLDRYQAVKSSPEAFQQMFWMEQRPKAKRLGTWTLLKCLYRAFFNSFLLKLTSSREREK